MVLKRTGVLRILKGLNLLVGRDRDVRIGHLILPPDGLGLTIDKLGVGSLLRLLLLL